MKLLPMSLPLVVGAQGTVVSLAVDHAFRCWPNLAPTSRCQFATASAMAAPRPSNSLVLLKGLNFARPAAVKGSPLHDAPCALAGSISMPGIISIAHAAASLRNRPA